MISFESVRATLSPLRKTNKVQLMILFVYVNTLPNQAHQSHLALDPNAAVFVVVYPPVASRVALPDLAVQQSWLLPL
jgi:hypothetical protein